MSPEMKDVLPTSVSGVNMWRKKPEEFGSLGSTTLQHEAAEN